MFHAQVCEGLCLFLSVETQDCTRENLHLHHWAHPVRLHHLHSSCTFDFSSLLLGEVNCRRKLLAEANSLSTAQKRTGTLTSFVLVAVSMWWEYLFLNLAYLFLNHGYLFLNNIACVPYVMAQNWSAEGGIHLLKYNSSYLLWHKLTRKRMDWNFSWGGARKEIGMMIVSESLRRYLQTSREQLILVLCIGQMLRVFENKNILIEMGYEKSVKEPNLSCFQLLWIPFCSVSKSWSTGREHLSPSSSCREPWVDSPLCPLPAEENSDIPCSAPAGDLRDHGSIGKEWQLGQLIFPNLPPHLERSSHSSPTEESWHEWEYLWCKLVFIGILSVQVQVTLKIQIIT